MNLNELNNKAGKISSARKRVGRGPGSGMGKTAGRGHKGAKSRSGYSRKDYFEGGGMPLIRRLPKRGFNNKRFHVEFAVLNVQDISEAFDAGTSVGPEEFLAAGKINRVLGGVKVLAKGQITKKLTVRAHHFSAAAIKKIEAAGGKVEILGNA